MAKTIIRRDILAGAATLVAACAILVLAWGLSAVPENLGTPLFLVEFLGDDLPLQALPALVFLLAAITAFSTGTSWGAMGILMPLVLQLMKGLSITYRVIY